MTCVKREVELILGCRNGVPVYKRERFFSDGVYDPSRDEYSDGLGALGRQVGDCSSTNYDYEKLVLCDLTGAKVLVESWTDVSDPLQIRTTRYTYLATNLPYTGNVSDLSDCGSEKLDIQTKQYCDGGETVFGTLVFDVSLGGANPPLLGIVFHKIDGSVHTPVSPVEGACLGSLTTIDTYSDVGNGTYTAVNGVKTINIRYDTYKNGYIPSVPNVSILISGASTGNKVLTILPNMFKSITIGSNDITSVTISGAINNTLEIEFIN